MEEVRKFGKSKMEKAENIVNSKKEEGKNFRKSFIWNIVGTGFNSFNSLIFLIIVTRINGIIDAGVFTLAFSTACILYVIGTYAGRVYQVTEVDRDITDKEYIVNRIFSCLLMMLVTIGFVIFRQYDWDKSIIFILLAFFKCLEAFSDVLYGILQKNDMLDIVGKSYFIKSLLSVVIFIIIDLVTHNIIISCVAIILVWIAIIIFYDMIRMKNLVNLSTKVNFSRVVRIFKKGFFIFAITFLGLYLLNAPKYAIDSFLTEDIQAIFGIIVMPATVMGLVGQFLMHPYLNTIVELYSENKIKELKKLILKIVIYIFGFGIFASILAYFLGVPVLNLIYGIDLNEYQIHLVAIIMASTLYNIGMIYSSVLTTIRSTFVQFIMYLIVVVITYVLSNSLTQSNGINGATIAYFVTMFVYFLLYIIIANLKLKSSKDKGKMGLIEENAKTIHDNERI